jgi:hypothetical protein
MIRHDAHLRIDPFGLALCCGIAAHGRGGRRVCLHYINYNKVHHVTQILADGAALYTLSNQ